MNKNLSPAQIAIIAATSLNFPVTSLGGGKVKRHGRLGSMQVMDQPSSPPPVLAPGDTPAKVAYRQNQLQQRKKKREKPVTVYGRLRDWSRETEG